MVKWRKRQERHSQDRKNEQKQKTEKSSLRGASCQRSSSSVPSFPATASLRCLHRKKMCMSGLSGCVCLDVFSVAGSLLRKKSSQASYSAVQLTVRVRLCTFHQRSRSIAVLPARHATHKAWHRDAPLSTSGFAGSPDIDATSHITKFHKQCPDSLYPLVI